MKYNVHFWLSQAEEAQERARKGAGDSEDNTGRGEMMNLLWKLATDRSPERHAKEKHREVSVRAGVRLGWFSTSFCPSSYSRQSLSLPRPLTSATPHATPSDPCHALSLTDYSSLTSGVCTLTVHLPHPSLSSPSAAYQTLAALSWARSDEDDDGWLRSLPLETRRGVRALRLRSVR